MIMDLDKIYYNADGEECNILQLVKAEPLWAANIIQHYEGVLNLFQKEKIMKNNFSTNVGDYLIIQINGQADSYIAEVIQSEPLIVKVTEDGPYAKLKAVSDDFIVLKDETEQFQEDVRNDTNFYLESKYQYALSGLKSLGVMDGKLHKMMPQAKGIEL